MPALSIIIAVYNDWTGLNSCLDSISQQASETDFEVIAVDDGSWDSAPEEIRGWSARLPLAIIRQVHEGISVARNRGIRAAKGSILLFVDADCRLEPNCLAALVSTISASPQHNCFQLSLTGSCSTLAGRTEHLRLTTLQGQLLQPDGRIRYVNTAGFAIRRSSVSTDAILFDPVSLRGEDTLLLADLIERDALPLFVDQAIVRHEVPSPLSKCLRKDIRSAFLEGPTYARIAARGIRIRMNNRQRWRMLRSMWGRSKQPSIGRLACLALILRQSLSRLTSLCYRVLHWGSTTQTKSMAASNGNL
jgi:glycosyltransferase involved in cell wall biosynthesis